MDVSNASPSSFPLRLDRGEGQGEVSNASCSPPSSRRLRLAILASHPIQYYAPWFRHLATRIDLEVMYAHKQDERGQAAAGFGVKFEWDVPLLDGYRHRWLKNISRRPGLQTFGGCDTPELFDLIRPENYDAMLVFGWNRKSFVQGIRAAWRNKVPVMCRGDSHLGTQRSVLKRVVKYLPYRALLPRINAHLYVGARNRYYLRHYGVRDEQLFFCPHFVDNNFFAARADEARCYGAAAKLREQLQIPREAFVALFVGKFISVKRPADFVRASLRARERQKNFHALLIGDGPLRGELEALVAANPRQIHFAGFRNQSEMPAYYATADVLVLPGSESWGLVVNEAMACGIPAIVSDAAGCAPDMIEEGATGWAYPLGDIAALVECLQRASGILPHRDAVRRKSDAYSMASATHGLERAVNRFATVRNAASL